MSAIRPDLPATTTPAQAPASAAVRSAQADFFRAALNQTTAAQATAGQRPTTTLQPAVTRTTSQPAATSSSAPMDRMARPGSLLDIRV